MENSFSVELEEDAIRYGHPQEFRVEVSELADLWVENLFEEEKNGIYAGTGYDQPGISGSDNIHQKEYCAVSPVYCSQF